MSDSPIESGHLACPNCTAAMQRHQFASVDVSPLEVDVCYNCHAIWFDGHESARLSADGVVDLFRFIHNKGGATTARLSANMPCARCRSPLTVANDIARTNRFSYYRCAKGHGRFTTFLHFLREKQFVRDLTLVERQRLAAHVRQIKCSSCSGPIDIAAQAACGYCGAAVSVLDKDATQKALDHYLKERQRQGRPAPATPALTHYPSSHQTGGGLDYLMFDIGTDVVSAFARLAARPMANAFSAGPAAAETMTGALAETATLPTLDDALTTSGLGDSLSLADAGFANAGLADHALGETLTSGLGTLGSSASEDASVLAEGAGSAFESVGESGLVDLVGDGIGAIVEGIFS